MNAVKIRIIDDLEIEIKSSKIKLPSQYSIVRLIL